MANSSRKLLRDQAAVLLVDHQDGLIANSHYPDPETLRRNTLCLVRAARVLDVPIIATTTMEAFFGPVFPALREALAESKIIERTIIDPFDDPKTLDAIIATGRKQLITAGVFASVCACIPAISAKQQGYSSYVAIDASAALNPIERDTAILRMTHAGVIVAVYAALIVEMLADNADPKARAVYEVIGSPGKT